MKLRGLTPGTSKVHTQGLGYCLPELSGSLHQICLNACNRETIENIVMFSVQSVYKAKSLKVEVGTSMANANPRCQVRRGVTCAREPPSGCLGMSLPARDNYSPGMPSIRSTAVQFQTGADQRPCLLRAFRPSFAA